MIKRSFALCKKEEVYRIKHFFVCGKGMLSRKFSRIFGMCNDPEIRNKDAKI